MTDLEVKNSLALESKMRISDAELAAFLRQLATLYRSPETGNPALSESLRDLAAWVGRRNVQQPRQLKSRAGHNPDVVARVHLNELKSLNAESIVKFIDDSNRTKYELVDLAHARFSIPRSQLLRMKISDVRNTIRTALMHENSIEIIAEEARRDGANRNS